MSGCTGSLQAARRTRGEWSLTGAAMRRQKAGEEGCFASESGGRRRNKEPGASHGQDLQVVEIACGWCRHDNADKNCGGRVEEVDWLDAVLEEHIGWLLGRAGDKNCCHEVGKVLARDVDGAIRQRS